MAVMTDSDGDNKRPTAITARRLLTPLIAGSLLGLMGGLMMRWPEFADTIMIVGIVGGFALFVAVPVAFMIAGYK